MAEAQKNLSSEEQKILEQQRLVLQEAQKEIEMNNGEEESDSRKKEKEKEKEKKKKDKEKAQALNET